MKVESLRSRPEGVIIAMVVMADGDRIEVHFSTTQRDGIAIANPDVPIFERDDLDAASVRAVIAAVIAFDAVATYPHEQRSDVSR